MLLINTVSHLSSVQNNTTAKLQKAFPVQLHSCLMCNTKERARENKPSWKKYSELRLLVSFTLPNHLKPCHTNTAVRLCCWLHRSEGQMISQLHFCSVCARKLSQLEGYSNKQCGTKRLQEKNNTNKLVCFIAALCSMQSFHFRVIFRHDTNKKNQEYFSFYSSLQKKPTDSSSSSIILNKSFWKPSVNVWAQLCSIPGALDSPPAVC